VSLTQTDIYQLAKSAGLEDSRAKMAAAIAMVESSGDPNAHNAKPPDDSYGLWQINMLGSMGPARRKQFGISDNSQLYDPQINAKAMALISQNGGNFNPWSTYTSGAAQRYMDTHLIQTTGPDPNKPGESWIDKVLPGSPVSAAETFAQGFNKVSSWVSNSSNWVRVGYVTGGAVIVIVGLAMLLGDTKAGKIVTGLTPTGKVGKVAKVAKTATAAGGAAS
jgi:hypothetical protein